jgi:hypothetical protein
MSLMVLRSSPFSESPLALLFAGCCFFAAFFANPRAGTAAAEAVARAPMRMEKGAPEEEEKEEEEEEEEEEVV